MATLPRTRRDRMRGVSYMTREAIVRLREDMEGRAELMEEFQQLKADRWRRGACRVPVSEGATGEPVCAPAYPAHVGARWFALVGQARSRRVRPACCAACCSFAVCCSPCVLACRAL